MNKFFKTCGSFMKKNSTKILFGCGIASQLSTCVFLVTGTIKAVRLFNEKREEILKSNPKSTTETIKIPPKDTAKIIAKCYIPAAISQTASIGCFIGANHIQNKNIAALAMAYKLSETALNELEAKVPDMVGQKKFDEIRAAISDDKIKENPPTKKNGGKDVVLIGDGDILCYDEISGRYFKSSADKIHKAENRLNERLINEMYMSLNEFYSMEEVGLPPIEIGSNIGWNIEKGLIDLRTSAHLTEDGRPALSVGYSIEPRYDYYKNG